MGDRGSWVVSTVAERSRKYSDGGQGQYASEKQRSGTRRFAFQNME